MPDGTTFVAFENGVLWLDEAGTIHNLDPIDPILVKAVSGIDPSPQGIAAFAQAKMDTLAAQAIQQNPQLSGNVSSITASAQFDLLAAGAVQEQASIRWGIRSYARIFSRCTSISS